MTELHEYCYACMEKLDTPDGVCSRCGYDNHNREHDMDCLPCMILQEQYLIGRKLGAGGFGITYIARDLQLDRIVAVKEYYPSSMARRQLDSCTLRARTENKLEYDHGCDRALEEGRLAARMGHVPGVVHIHNAFRANGTVYIVMEYISGKTLANTVRDLGGRMPWPELVALMEPLMTTLTIIHSMRIIHRDVSPDNIMIRSDGTAVLLDFGAAHTISDRTMSEHSVSIRFGYAPAEQYSSTGQLDGRMDQYALCATMYFALVGVPPMDAFERAYGGAQLQSPRALGVEIPAHADAALMKGMSLKMTDRFATVEELRQAMLKTRPKPVNYKVIALAATGALAVAAAGYLLLRPGEENVQPQPAASIVTQTAAAAPTTRVPTAAPTVTATPTEAVTDAPTNTPVPPTETPVPPTDTPAPPTDTPVPPTDTPAPPTDTPVPHPVKVPIYSVDASNSILAEHAVLVQPGQRMTVRAEDYAPEGYYAALQKAVELFILDGGEINQAEVVFVYTQLTPTPMPERMTFEAFDLLRNDAGAWTIFQYTGQAASVVIPGEIYGIPVTHIRDFAFDKNTSLQQLTLPEGLVEIGEGAFAGCTGLETVQLPASVKRVRDAAFGDCSSLTLAEFQGREVSIDEAAFIDCRQLTLRVIPGSDAEHYARTYGYPYMYSDGSPTPTEVPPATPEPTPELTPVPEKMLYEDFDLEYNGMGWTLMKYNGWEAEVIVPAEIHGLPVTRLGEYAFHNHTEVVSITLPKTVTEISGGAFSDCTSLKQVNIPQGVTVISDNTFTSCSALEDIELPAGVMEIRAYAFDRCTQLRQIVLPDGLELIGQAAFANTALTNMEFPAGLRQIGEEAFDRCAALTEAVFHGTDTEIHESAFTNCSQLTIWVYPGTRPAAFAQQFGSYGYLDGTPTPTPAPTPVPDELVVDGVTLARLEDGSWCVTGWTDDGAAELTIPAGVLGSPVTQIGDDAFHMNRTLETVILPETITQIGRAAFADCSLLSHITLPEGLQRIDMHAFLRCPYLTDIMLPETLEEIGPSAFKLSGLTQISLPASVHSIGEEAFAECGSLARIVFNGRQLTKISEGTFRNCTRLFELENFADTGITEIGAQAFAGCLSLQEVYLPGALTQIGEGAFDNCDHVTLVGRWGETMIKGWAEENQVEYAQGVQLLAPAPLYKASRTNSEICGMGGTWEWLRVEKADKNWTRVTWQGQRAYVETRFLTCRELPASREYELDWAEDCGLCIVRYTGSTNTASIRIPSKISGFPVTQIGTGEAYVLENMKNLHTLVLLDPVATVETMLVRECPRLRNVTIPASVVNIGSVHQDAAFLGSTANLARLTNPFASLPQPLTITVETGSEAEKFFGYIEGYTLK